MNSLGGTQALSEVQATCGICRKTLTLRNDRMVTGKVQYFNSSEYFFPQYIADLGLKNLIDMGLLPIIS